MGDNRGVIIRDELPSNSHNSKREAAAEQKKEISKIVKGRVATRKKSLGKKIVETFSGGEGASVSDFILHDILVPSIKEMLYKVITGGTEISLFGQKRTPNVNRVGGSSYISYGGITRDPVQRNQGFATSAKRGRSFEEIIFEHRTDAEETLSGMLDVLETYNVVTVADFYDLIGRTGNYTDNKFGWFDLSSSSVSRVREGYIINLPKIVEVD